MHPMVGKPVMYTRPRGTGKNRKLEPVAAIIVGVEPQGADGIEAPLLHLAFVNPDRVEELQGSGWTDAFDRDFQVKHASHDVVQDNEGEVGFWETTNEYRMRTTYAASNEQPPAQAPDPNPPTVTEVPPAPPAPSAEDLDKVAEEEAIKQATGGEQAEPSKTE